ncbi:hypothetical protein LJC53_07460, partial [Bacteroidales bacterium OttesenSCG-928-C03]|nr:hypothetical protein [Bacteroidales bacterium OttesenSCG-928-C03]
HSFGEVLRKYREDSSRLEIALLLISALSLLVLTIYLTVIANFFLAFFALGLMLPAFYLTFYKRYS